MVEIIQVAVKKDRKSCVKIITDCLTTITSKYYSPKFIENLVKKYKRKFMKRPELEVYVIKIQDKILGTGSISTRGQISDIFIDPNNHRKGFGQKMIRKLEEVAKKRNITELFLYGSVSAIEFYEKMGYFKVDQLDHGNGDIELRMEKSL
ncbi:MAG: GNAT family N-acetyltransferase [Candidatus Thorarchaeota archaeon]